jgi:hypothetical protein
MNGTRVLLKRAPGFFVTAQHELPALTERCGCRFARHERRLASFWPVPRFPLFCLKKAMFAAGGFRRLLTPR